MMTNDTSSVFEDEKALAVQAVTTPPAYTELYHRYYSRVFNYVRYRCEDLATAEDLTALVFERLLVRIGAYCPDRGPFGAWLFAIARNTVNGHLRTAHRHSWISIDLLNQRSGQDVGLEEAAIQKESAADFLKLIEGLGERERDLLGLKFAAHFTNRQIAELTGLSESNVGVILYRTLSRLRKGFVNKELTLVSLEDRMESSHGRA
jgi:RNA polymerase sigma-70 factor (ECF subfamily)